MLYPNGYRGFESHPLRHNLKDEVGRLKAESLAEDLKQRTKEFSVRIIRLFSALPKSTEAQVLGSQLLRSATSVGAQYRESQRAKSTADFISKIEGSLQELEETAY